MNLTKSILMASIVLVVVAVLTDCGSGGSTSTTATPTQPSTAIQSVTLSCAGSSCTAQTGATLQLNATVTCVAVGNCNTAISAWYVCSGTTSAPTGCVLLGDLASIGSVDNNGLYTAPSAVPSGSVVAKACGSDGATCGTIAITVTAATVPTEVAYINSSISNASCSAPGATEPSQSQCQITYGLDANNPSGQYRVDPFYAGQDLNAAISPDSKTIAITRNDWSTTPGDTEVVTVPFSGGTPTLVRGGFASNKITLTGIDWRPDGSGFVLTTIDKAQNLCYVATLSKDGSVFKQLTATNMDCSAMGINWPQNPRYLPDGRIVYAKASKLNNNSADAYHIFVVSADGSAETDISNSATTGDTFPSPSPDGTQIAYMGENGIAIMNTDGTQVTPVTPQPPVTPQLGGNQPSWCHDGNIVFFSGGTSGSPGGQLFSVNPSTNKTIQLTNDWMTLRMDPYCR
jgi:hypothetical protein